MRVFAAQQRLAGWLTYGRLVEAAGWLRDWRANPPIGSCLPDDPDQSGDPHNPDDPDDPDDPDNPDDPNDPDGPDDPDDADGRGGPEDAGRVEGGGVGSDRVGREAMVDRLEGVACGYERRAFPPDLGHGVGLRGGGQRNGAAGVGGLVGGR